MNFLFFILYELVKVYQWNSNEKGFVEITLLIKKVFLFKLPISKPHTLTLISHLLEFIVNFG